MLPTEFFSVRPGTKISDNQGLLEPFDDDLYTLTKLKFGVEPTFKNEYFWLLKNSLRKDIGRSLLECPFTPAFISATDDSIYKLGGFFGIDDYPDSLEWFANVYDFTQTLNPISHEKVCNTPDSHAHLWEFKNGNIVLGLDPPFISMFITSYNATIFKKKSLFTRLFGS